jgi:hypothetical protein
LDPSTLSERPIEEIHNELLGNLMLFQRHKLVPPKQEIASQEDGVQPPIVLGKDASDRAPNIPAVLQGAFHNSEVAQVLASRHQARKGLSTVPETTAEVAAVPESSVGVANEPTGLAVCRAAYSQISLTESPKEAPVEADGQLHAPHEAELEADTLRESGFRPKRRKIKASPSAPASKSSTIETEQNPATELQKLDQYLSDFTSIDLNSMLASRPGTGLLPLVTPSPGRASAVKHPPEDAKIAKVSTTPRLPSIDPKTTGLRTSEGLGDVARQRSCAEDRLIRLDQCVKRAERADHAEKTMAAIYGITKWNGRDWKGPRRHRSASPRKPRRAGDAKPEGSLTAR